MLTLFIVLSGLFAAAFLLLFFVTKNRQKRTRDFLSVASHDICSPLANIKGYCDGLRDGMFSGREDEILALVSDETMRVSRLASQLGEHKTAEMSFFGAVDVFSRSVLLFENAAAKRGVAIRTEFPEDEIYVRADKDMISEVLYNLLSNAVKYADGNEIVCKAESCGEKCRFSVSNKALIDVDSKKLFSRGFRAANSFGKDGKGLGLFIASEIIKKHGEKLCADIKDGMCTFSFELASGHTQE